MNSPSPRQPKDRLARLLSFPAAILWLGALAFTTKWLHAWSVGKLEPGVGTSGEVLFTVFAVALLLSLGGMYLSVRAWRGRSTLRWQVGSLLGAILVLWAVCGG